MHLSHDSTFSLTDSQSLTGCHWQQMKHQKWQTNPAPEFDRGLATPWGLRTWSLPSYGLGADISSGVSREGNAILPPVVQEFYD